VLSSEAARFGLPTDMPIFFYESYPELIYLGPDPDRWRGAPASQTFSQRSQRDCCGEVTGASFGPHSHRL
jgi:hypothetical protein